jgi:hypothetical protein
MQGLLDGSLSLLNRNDRSSNGTLGHGEQAYANVSNGNLLIQQRDAFLPSRGADFDLIRTYNSRAKIAADSIGAGAGPPGSGFRATTTGW